MSGSADTPTSGTMDLAQAQAQARAQAQADDARARLSAQTVFDRPVVVEAGAGTGKTSILVARVLGWTLGAGWAEAQTDLTAALAAAHESGNPEGGRPESEARPDPGDVAARVLDGVVALTFTEAAAAEMASRIASALATLARGASLGPAFAPEALAGDPGAEVLAARARALLGQLDRLTACTIHAFCYTVLRRHPLEAGLHPDFVIDARGERLEEIVRGVVEDAVKSAYATSDPADPLIRLATSGQTPQRLAEALRYFAFEGVPSRGLEADPFERDVMIGLATDLLDDLEAFLELTAGDLAGIKRTVNPKRAEEAASASAAAVREALDTVGSGAGSGLALVTGLAATLTSIWEPKAWSHWKKWAKGSFGKGEAETLGDRQDRVARLAEKIRRPIAYLRKASPELFDAGRRCLEPLLARVEAEARTAGVVNFQALLRDAQALLAEHPGTLRYERGRIRQLLVDEFQDTDKLQCDIVRRLALTGDPAGEDAGAGQLGLFLVGDPKQSIYGWRNADLAAYESLVELAVEAGGERFALVRNFRSRPEILTEVERAVAPVMMAEPGVQPGFEPLIASAAADEAEAADPGSSPVEFWISWHPDQGGTTRHGEAAEIEARAIAEDLERLHASGVRWKDCALLMRNASRVDTYLEAFRDRAVPFVVTSDKQYFRRREVIDAAALIRTVIAPADHVALVTFLRSPVVGVPDAALIPLWSRELPRLLTELDGTDPEINLRLDAIEAVVREAAGEVPADLPGLKALAGWEEAAVFAIRALAELRRSAAEEPADRFLERLRRTLLQEATEAARYLGRYRVANLARLFRTVEAGLEQQRGDYRSVLRLLRRSISMALDAEEALPREAAEDAVQVMTIHKAKGLEFDHVYLAQLHAQGQSSERSPLDADRGWTGSGPLELVLFDQATLGFEAVERHRERVAAAEQVRTLYVAMTRARKRLVLVGNWPDPPKRGRSKQPTYVDLLRSRAGLPASLADLGETAGVLREGVVDAEGVRWRFPGLSAGEPEAPSPPPARPPLSRADLAGIAKASDELLERRRRARRHRDRPLFSGAAVGHDLENPETPPDSGPAGPREGPAQPDAHGVDRTIALALGETIHAALQAWDFYRPIESERRRHLRRGHAALATKGLGPRLDRARELYDEMLGRLASGSLLERLVESPDQVVARECPVLLPAGAGEPAGPIVAVSGIVDLVLRGSDGRYTVVDFKTDRLEDGDELERRAAVYAGQLDTYATALAQALDLEDPPGQELWFLWPDRSWTPAGPAGARQSDPRA